MINQLTKDKIMKNGEIYESVSTPSASGKITDIKLDGDKIMVSNDNGKTYIKGYSQSRISKMPNNSIKLQNDGIFSDDRLSKYKNDTNFVSNDEIGYISNEDIINLFK